MDESSSADCPTDHCVQDTQLFDLVFQRIQENPSRSISFSDYMEMVLYHPEFGYYTCPERRRIGRRGDFYTSVSVGETFGFLLAQQLKVDWELLERPDPFVVVEQGAHDGQLAHDILKSLDELLGLPMSSSLQYRIVEPKDSARRWLGQSWASDENPRRIQVVESIEAAHATSGVFLCNELLDAFPVDRLRYENESWRQWRVGECEGKLGWVAGDAYDAQQLPAELLEDHFETGYTTEICLAAGGWMREVSTLFETGIWRVIDYGHESHDYYAPHRKRGTLRCYRDHEATEDPFKSLGNVDITAHVNFTQLREAAEAAGLSEKRLTDQHHFLIEAARPWLLSLEGEPPSPELAQRIRQFQTLTHPSIMGQQFKVAEYVRGI
ncbi:MAG: SAM-dependent methyltransferase [Verrucomicrobiota bacterium]